MSFFKSLFTRKHPDRDFCFEFMRGMIREQRRTHGDKMPTRAELFILAQIVLTKMGKPAKPLPGFTAIYPGPQTSA